MDAVTATGPEHRYGIINASAAITLPLTRFTATASSSTIILQQSRRPSASRSSSPSAVAGQGEVVAGLPMAAEPATTSLPSGCSASAPALSLSPAEVGGHLAAAAEGRVQAAVGVVAGQGEVEVAAVMAADPATTILPSGCSTSAPALSLSPAEVGGHLAAAAEGGVEAAVGVVAGQGEVVAAAGWRL